MGDRIRFLRMPLAYSRPGFQIDPSTLALYAHLISSGEPLVVEDFLDGEPIAGYVDRRQPDDPVYHALIIDAIDDGCWERVLE